MMSAFSARSHAIGCCFSLQNLCFKPTSVVVQTLNFSPKCKQIIAFPLAPLHFQNLCPAFSFLRETQKEKANIKSFGKEKGVPPSLKLRRTRQGNGGSRARQGDSRQSPGGTFATVWSAFASFPSLQISAKYVPKIHQCYRAYAQHPRKQTDSCIFLLPFFIFKTYVPLFHFCVKRKMKKRT